MHQSTKKSFSFVLPGHTSIHLHAQLHVVFVTTPKWGSTLTVMIYWIVELDSRLFRLWDDRTLQYWIEYSGNEPLRSVFFRTTTYTRLSDE